MKSLERLVKERGELHAKLRTMGAALDYYADYSKKLEQMRAALLKIARAKTSQVCDCQCSQYALEKWKELES